MTGGHQHHEHEGHEHEHGHDEGLRELLELDDVVLADYWDAAVDAAATTAGPQVRAVLDLGAGTGTGTLRLARRFPTATVRAVDLSPDSLATITRHAAAAGLGERVRTVQADLDDGLPPLTDPPQLVWASTSLHHLADPDRTLRQVRAAVAPGGVIAVAEFGDPLRVLPASEAELEDRLVAATAQAYREHLPTLGSDWSARLAAAGWDMLSERDFVIDLPTHDAAAAQYAYGWLTRIVQRVAGAFDGSDQRRLADLLAGGADGLAGRGVHLRGTRTLTLARG